MTKGHSNKPLLDRIVCKNYFRTFSHDTAKKSVLFKLLNLVTEVIPEYIMGRILYRYQIYGNKLAPFLGGILPLFPWKAASPRNVEYGWIIKNLTRLRKSQKIKRI